MVKVHFSHHEQKQQRQFITSDRIKRSVTHTNELSAKELEHQRWVVLLNFYILWVILVLKGLKGLRMHCYIKIKKFMLTFSNHMWRGKRFIVFCFFTAKKLQRLVFISPLVKCVWFNNSLSLSCMCEEPQRPEVSPAAKQYRRTNFCFAFTSS